MMTIPNSDEQHDHLHFASEKATAAPLGVKTALRPLDIDATSLKAVGFRSEHRPYAGYSCAFGNMTLGYALLQEELHRPPRLSMQAMTHHACSTSNSPR